MSDNAAAVKTSSLNLMTTFAGDNSFAYDVNAPYHPEEFMGCIADVAQFHTPHPQSCVGGDGEMHCATNVTSTEH